jgi:hypothetical protein
MAMKKYITNDHYVGKYTNTFRFKDPPKITNIGIFCLKMYHLATLIVPANASQINLFTRREDTSGLLASLEKYALSNWLSKILS